MHTCTTLLLQKHQKYTHGYAHNDMHAQIESAGWHCSFFSDVQGVVQKVKAFTHQELNTQVLLFYAVLK